MTVCCKFDFNPGGRLTFDRTSYGGRRVFLLKARILSFACTVCLFIVFVCVRTFLFAVLCGAAPARTRTEVSRNNDKAARFYVLHAIGNSISLRISAAPERVVLWTRLCHSVMFIVMTEEILPCTTQRDVCKSLLCAMSTRLLNGYDLTTKVLGVLLICYSHSFADNDISFRVKNSVVTRSRFFKLISCC